MNSETERARNARKRAKLRAKSRGDGQFTSISTSARYLCALDTWNGKSNPPPTEKWMADHHYPHIWQSTISRSLYFVKVVGVLDIPAVLTNLHDVPQQLMEVVENVCNQINKTRWGHWMDKSREECPKTHCELTITVRFKGEERRKQWLLTNGVQVVAADVIAEVVRMRAQLANLPTSWK